MTISALCAVLTAPSEAALAVFLCLLPQVRSQTTANQGRDRPSLLPSPPSHAKWEEEEGRTSGPGKTRTAGEGKRGARGSLAEKVSDCDVRRTENHGRGREGTAASSGGPGEQEPGTGREYVGRHTFY